MTPLAPEQLAQFERDGCLLLRGYFSPEEMAAAGRAIDGLAARPPRVGHEMVYFEPSITDPAKKVLQHIEKFVEEDATLRRLITERGLAELTAQLFGAPVLLFKEKINFKMPGGQGFAPHQSGPNLTAKPRRNLYLTYNRADQGDFRTRYFTDKRASFPPDFERAPGAEYKFKV
jgi:Phytanoyl-CoA dioxygenase (PhyH)